MTDPLADAITTLPALLDAMQAKPTPTVWGYVRVSSAKQEDGESAGMQIADIRAYCAHKGLPPPAIVFEVGSAGKPLFTTSFQGASVFGAEQGTDPRPLFSQLLLHLKDLGQGAHLVAWRLDRISRLQNEQDIILQILRQEEVVVHSCDAAEQINLDTGNWSDPTRRLLRAIMGAVAEYERGLLTLRTVAGMRAKAARGSFPGGQPPYGYDLVDGDLKVNPNKALVVQRVFYLRDAEAASLRLIAEDLNRVLNTTAWNKMRIKRIIDARKTYEGRPEWLGAERERGDLRVIQPAGSANYSAWLSAMMDRERYQPWTPPPGLFTDTPPEGHE